ncbi:MAG: hypothetical protein U0X74_06705 [Anaerolineales bacterium]
MIGTEKNERRDWTMLIFIIPIGIILIIFVGQLAVRLVPFWRVEADMNSNLEPDASSSRPFALLEPILPQILTPMAWAESYLTPGAAVNFPPFLTFEPSSTPIPVTVTITPEVSPTVTTVTSTSSPTGSATLQPPGGGSSTPTPPNGGGGSSTPPTTCQDPVADNFGGALPCDYTSTTTCQDHAADNFGGALPCDYTSTTTCQDSLANNYGGLLPCDYGVISTVDPGYGTPVTPIPSQIGVGELPDNTDPTSIANIGEINTGTYIVINLSVVVGNTPDSNYDLAYYEYNNNGFVNIDWIIIGISNYADGSQYYEIFNWGNGSPDNNSNVGDVAQTSGTELDNQTIPVSGNTEVPQSQTELYDPDYSPGTPDTNGPLPQTGILIDVDSATSAPPPNTYNYVVIIAPMGDSDGGAQIDAVQTVEVPIPTPTP